MTIKKVKDAVRRAPVSAREPDAISCPGMREEMLRATPAFRRIFNKDKKTRVRILIVADGAIGFDDREFGLSELINKALLPNAYPSEELEIITAHRSSKDTSANIPGFRFDVTPRSTYGRPFTREFYEQVWLFGSKGVKSDDGVRDESERKALMDFMNDGGGVFATGDHQDLGAGLCYEVPRVQHMRKWLHLDDVPPHLKAPGVSDETRVDTLREGFDTGFQFNDQSDRVPKQIYPKFRVINSFSVPQPHPLLGYRDSAIRVLPDHMHEGECIVPTELDKKTVKFGDDVYDEFPPIHDMEARLAPDVVAVSTSVGGFLTDTINIFPADPRCYNVIVAYEGDLVDRVVNKQRLGKGVGRVVVDSSFHHFLNVNLNGTGSSDPFKRGFYDSFGRPTRDYFAVQHYYRNLVTWLNPRDARTRHYANLLLAVRYMSPLIEEIRPIEDPSPSDKICVGALTRRAITERFSQAEAAQCTMAAVNLLSEKVGDMLAPFINPWLPSELHEEDLTLLFNAETISAFCLGCAMLNLASSLPEAPDEAAESLERMESQEGKRLEDLIVEDRHGSLDSLTKIIRTVKESSRQLLGSSTLLPKQS